MTELRVGDQLVRFDREATITAYSAIAEGWAERCNCSGCRNFVVARGQAFPNDFRTVLSELGIDPLREGEAVHYGPVEGNLHFYGGWFYLVGELIEVGERSRPYRCLVHNFVSGNFPAHGRASSIGSIRVLPAHPQFSAKLLSLLNSRLCCLGYWKIHTIQ